MLVLAAGFKAGALAISPGGPVVVVASGGADVVPHPLEATATTTAPPEATTTTRPTGEIGNVATAARLAEVVALAGADAAPPATQGDATAIARLAQVGVTFPALTGADGAPPATLAAQDNVATAARLAQVGAIAGAYGAPTATQGDATAVTRLAQVGATPRALTPID